MKIAAWFCVCVLVLTGCGGQKYEPASNNPDYNTQPWYKRNPLDPNGSQWYKRVGMLDILNHQYFQVTHKSARGKINGYGKISFGMKRDDVKKALGEDGQEIALESAEKPNIYFKEHYQNQELDGWIYFKKDTDAVSRIELTSVNALGAVKDDSECKSVFKQFVDSYEQKYGDPDFDVKYKSENKEDKATAFFTFGDSSNIRVLYNFNNEKRKCVVKIQYNASWI